MGVRIHGSRRRGVADSIIDAVGLVDREHSNDRSAISMTQLNVCATCISYSRCNGPSLWQYRFAAFCQLSSHRCFGVREPFSVRIQSQQFIALDTFNGHGARLVSGASHPDKDQKAHDSPHLEIAICILYELTPGIKLAFHLAPSGSKVLYT